MVEKEIDVPEMENITKMAVADPGFGQGGGQEFFPRFCRCSEVKFGKQSEQCGVSV